MAHAGFEFGQVQRSGADRRRWGRFRIWHGLVRRVGLTCDGWQPRSVGVKLAANGRQWERPVRLPRPSSIVLVLLPWGVIYLFAPRRATGTLTALD